MRIVYGQCTIDLVLLLYRLASRRKYPTAALINGNDWDYLSSGAKTKTFQFINCLWWWLTAIVRHGHWRISTNYYIYVVFLQTIRDTVLLNQLQIIDNPYFYCCIDNRFNMCATGEAQWAVFFSFVFTTSFVMLHLKLLSQRLVQGSFLESLIIQFLNLFIAHHLRSGTTSVLQLFFVLIFQFVFHKSISSLLVPIVLEATTSQAFEEDKMSSIFDD